MSNEDRLIEAFADVAPDSYYGPDGMTDKGKAALDTFMEAHQPGLSIKQ